MGLIGDPARRAYAEDGVALIRGAFAQDWVAALLPAALELIDMARREEMQTGFPASLKNLWSRHAAFRRFVFGSPASAMAGQIVRSNTMSLALDQIWAKAPKSASKTRWHYDRPAWPIQGMMLPSIWLALTPVRRENALQFVAGSHSIPRDPQSTDFTDYEDHRGDPAIGFLSWDIQPGDALIFHPMAYHFCRGNSEDDWRVALTTRWIGDDIRYDPSLPYIDEGLSFDGCSAGEPLRGPEFPLVWRSAEIMTSQDAS